MNKQGSASPAAAGAIAGMGGLPAPVWMFAAVSLLNEVSAQMAAPLIPILLVAVLSAGPVAPGCGGARRAPVWHSASLPQ